MPTAFPEVYKQAISPQHALNDIAIIEELQDNSVKLLLGRQRRERRLTPGLVSRWTLGVAESAAADVAVHGRHGARRAAVHSDPPGRAAGMDLPVQGLAPQRHPRGPAGTRARGDRTTFRRRRHRDLARQGRDRPLQRTGASGRTDLAAGRHPSLVRQIPAAGRLSVQPVPYRDGAQRQRRHRPLVGRSLRGPVLPGRPGRGRGEPGRAGGRGGRLCGHRRLGEPRHRPGAARLRVDDSGDAAHQLFRRSAGLGAGAERVVVQAQS